MTDIYPVPAEVQELRDEVGRLLELLAQTGTAQPWYVVGVDALPDDNRRVEVTILWPFKERTREIWSYDKTLMDKWRNVYWRTEEDRNVKVVAWCELGKPWQGKL